MTPPPPISGGTIEKPAEAPQPKKRGFWGRIFGRGDKVKDNKKEKKPGGGGG